jgi:hypothetical protein
MLEHTFVRTGVTARLRWSPLGPYLDALATSLHHEGYPPSSIQRFLCAAEKCAQWAQRQGDAFGEMDEDLLNAISPDSHDTVPGTFPKRPKVWAPSSDPSSNTASRAHGKLVFRSHRSISG